MTEPTTPQRGLARAIKRAADTVLATVGLVLASPVLAVSALLIRLASPGPVLFVQERGGWRGRPFRILKLRTMLELRDEQGVLLPDAQRINAVGHFLRKTSFDELPQLLNILRGEMSFIGPRPLPVAYLPRYSPEQMRRHEVLPGMGSYADVVHNRSVPNWAAVFASDVWYVDHWSLGLDVRLFFTIAVMVLGRKGSEQGATGAMPEFRPEGRE
jgi:lipopolysaccharide/colanic/teichoic acid biosynthesis glycosyltransferase